MSTKVLGTNFFPLLNIEKETKRWNNLYKIMTEHKPEIVPTPRQRIWKKNKTTLWYHPAKDKKHDVPIFLVYSLLNKVYILDVGEGSSVVGGLTERGYDVYLLDWGSPGLEDSDITLDNYIIDYMENALKRALRHSGAKEISLAGYCLGGTIAAILASITKLPIRNLTLAAVPIDFSIGIVPDKWLEGLQKGSLSFDQFTDAHETIPSEFLYLMFRVLSPVYGSPKINLITRAHDEEYVEKWRRMDKWTKDTASFTGAAFKQMFNDLYKDNKLLKGDLMIGGRKVDLKNITCPLFVFSCSRDTLVLDKQSLPVMDLVSSEDKTYEVYEGGHVSLALTGVFAEIWDKWLSSRSLDAEKEPV
ncbi:poly(R)-hydroxyalkanoic acid synthase, class III, PhaC subunit [Neobacillus bataviensis LMG 21833]|uniref:Poly(R)-hydroxyalkanoic acid synthase, class III, PhaC subunit n=1 Tax=Neobacillus bataviensis LMG 21833 TaxID=1117379 RepID=K6DKC8_9BACI|nr:alpha/beta fold hydrolase [Neobacillus bataviensis]EKN68769.1 poly(R)-hydroxyalkanoic acid synthase, class III, PhaC subunit [Neobacillus bataviensis LMG 21833]